MTGDDAVPEAGWISPDLREELPGMELNETLIAACRSAELRATSYLEAYVELAQHLNSSLSSHPEAAFFQHLAEQMEIWAEAVDSISHRASHARAA